METEFKTGDCVELKYGLESPKMVIDQLFVYQGDKRAVCKWFAKESGKFEKEAFSLNSLKKCEPV